MSKITRVFRRVFLGNSKDNNEVKSGQPSNSRSKKESVTVTTVTTGVGEAGPVPTQMGFVGAEATQAAECGLSQLKRKLRAAHNRHHHHYAKHLTTDYSKTHAEILDEDDREIETHFQRLRGLASLFRDQTVRLKLIKQCASGKEIVDHIISSKIATERSEAITVAWRIIDAGWLYNASDTMFPNEFLDDSHFYYAIADTSLPSQIKQHITDFASCYDGRRRDSEDAGTKPTPPAEETNDTEDTDETLPIQRSTSNKLRVSTTTGPLFNEMHIKPLLFGKKDPHVVAGSLQQIGHVRRVRRFVVFFEQDHQIYVLPHQKSSRCIASYCIKGWKFQVSLCGQFCYLYAPPFISQNPRLVFKFLKDRSLWKAKTAWVRSLIDAGLSLLENEPICSVKRYLERERLEASRAQAQQSELQRVRGYLSVLDMLETPQYDLVFRQFLEKNFCIESYNFLVAARAFRAKYTEGGFHFGQQTMVASPAISDKDKDKEKRDDGDSMKKKATGMGMGGPLKFKDVAGVDESALNVKNTKSKIEARAEGKLETEKEAAMRADLRKDVAYIYESFIKENAPSLVNLDAASTNEIVDRVQNDELDADLFDGAVYVIVKLLECDIFLRFTSTPEYETMLTNAPESEHLTLRSGRRQRMSFSALPQEENYAFLEILVSALPLTGLIADRRWRLVKHKNCFVGKYFVDWLIQNDYSKTRAGGVSIGQRLLDARHIRHVQDDFEFQDSYLFYVLHDSKVDVSAPQLIFNSLHLREDSVASTNHGSSNNNSRTPSSPSNNAGSIVHSPSISVSQSFTSSQSFSTSTASSSQSQSLILSELHPNTAIRSGWVFLKGICYNKFFAILTANGDFYLFKDESARKPRFFCNIKDGVGWWSTEEVEGGLGKLITYVLIGSLSVPNDVTLRIDDKGEDWVDSLNMLGLELTQRDSNGSEVSEGTLVSTSTSSTIGPSKSPQGSVSRSTASNLSVAYSAPGTLSPTSSPSPNTSSGGRRNLSSGSVSVSVTTATAAPAIHRATSSTSSNGSNEGAAHKFYISYSSDSPESRPSASPSNPTPVSLKAASSPKAKNVSHK